MDSVREPLHVPTLDGVRGIAILLVLAHNLNVVAPDSALTRLLGLTMNFGWIGVQLFFVLSGYLITGILLDTRRAENYWQAFLGRRMLRIFPLYYAMLAFAFIVVPLMGTPLEGHEEQIWLWTYLSNWVEPFGHQVSLFPHFWSLAVEEQFYLAWPLIVVLQSSRALVRTCIALCVIALISRIALVMIHAPPDMAYMFTICRMDALAMGGIAAVLMRSPRAVAMFDAARTRFRWGALSLLILTILTTRGAPRIGVLTQTFGYTTLALTFVVFVFDAARSKDLWTRLVGSAPLRALGKYSYAMYLFHLPLHLLVGLPLLAHWTGATETGALYALAYFAAATLATLGAAMLSYYGLESPCLRLRRWFVPRPRSIPSLARKRVRTG